jgi:hypothetical protein
MSSVYFILLAFALCSIWISIRTSEDIPVVLAGLTGIACFIWSFAYVHWSIQILVVFCLYRLYKFYLPEETL